MGGTLQRAGDWGKPLEDLNLKKEACVPENANNQQPVETSEQPGPDTNRKREMTCSSHLKIKKNNKEKTVKDEKTPRKKSGRKSFQLPPTCPRNYKRTVRPTIFLCSHKTNNAKIKTHHSQNKKRWNIKPFHVTSCGSRKCKAWVRNLKRATAVSEVNVEEIEDT
ncbi:rCG35727 [Rattus norvegicus]|uniref:RCG35727 n=1 Tax=Rattus norvegicus TaxID=10116 RepID=A6IJE0_RAT|nr:rCG35727 [Rattus norvegicus]